MFEFERCILLLHKARRCKSAPSHAISGGLEGGEGVANVDAPGYAGVPILRDLQLAIDSVPGARLQSATPSLSPPPATIAVEGTGIAAWLACMRGM